jgi:putative colanic acid biosynthesis acetyltransferase WcaF
MIWKGPLYYTYPDYVRRALWALCQPLWLYSPRWCWGLRCFMLRVFGAEVSQRVRIYPSSRIYQPWNLAVGSDVTIAWGTVLYCLGMVSIGANVVISQGAHICAGSHDIRDPSFPLLKLPVTIGSGVWIAAESFIGPNVSVGRQAVVGARAVVVRDVPDESVVAGNPAVVIGKR